MLILLYIHEPIEEGYESTLISKYLFLCFEFFL